MKIFNDASLEHRHVELQLTAAMIYSTVLVWVPPLAALFGIGCGLADYLHLPLWFDLGVGVHDLSAILVDPVFTTGVGMIFAVLLATLIFGAVWLRIALKSVAHKLHLGGHQTRHV